MHFDDDAVEDDYVKSITSEMQTTKQLDSFKLLVLLFGQEFHFEDDLVSFTKNGIPSI
jgi:hypothetical protein